MRIGIDARMITHPGIGRYIRGLLKGISESEKDYKYLLLGDKEHLEEFLERHNFSFRASNAPIYGIREQLSLFLKVRGVDVFHFPHYNIPILYKDKYVSTVHDLIHLIFPEHLPSKLAYLYAKNMFRALAKNSEKVITVSENTKNDLIKYTDISPYKIKVIYEGVDPTFRRLDEETLDFTRFKYNLHKPFILFVGTLKPHKNVIGMLNAYLHLKRSGKIEEQLVIVGRQDKKAKQINNFLESLGPEDGIRYLGGIPHDDMPRIYNLAKMLLFVSFYEGFGLPPLEAMACGVPCLCSNAASIPEVVGDAALLIDPHSEEEISDGIYKLVQNDSLRKELVCNGFERIKLFNWNDTAKKTLEVYEEVLQ